MTKKPDKKKTDSKNEFLHLIDTYHDVIDKEDLRTFFTARSDLWRDFSNWYLLTAVSLSSFAISTIALVTSLNSSFLSIFIDILIVVFVSFYGFSLFRIAAHFRNEIFHFGKTPSPDVQLRIFEDYLKAKQEMSQRK